VAEVQKFGIVLPPPEESEQNATGMDVDVVNIMGEGRYDNISVPTLNVPIE
jgi:hypothetical protein